MKKEYQHIFEPFTVRRMTMKNRIMMTQWERTTENPVEK